MYLLIGIFGHITYFHLFANLQDNLAIRTLTIRQNVKKTYDNYIRWLSHTKISSPIWPWKPSQ